MGRLHPWLPANLAGRSGLLDRLNLANPPDQMGHPMDQLDLVDPMDQRVRRCRQNLWVPQDPMDRPMNRLGPVVLPDLALRLHPQDPEFHWHLPGQQGPLLLPRPLPQLDPAHPEFPEVRSDLLRLGGLTDRQDLNHLQVLGDLEYLQALGDLEYLQVLTHQLGLQDRPVPANPEVLQLPEGRASQENQQRMRL